MRDDPTGSSVSPAMQAGTAAAGARWRRHGITVAALAALCLPMALAYQAALARVPHQRAAIEAVLKAYTGLDLRFATLELGWGWGGPEAVFTRVALADPQRTSVGIRARRLVIGFNGWASFRRGELEISRVALVAPDIDLTDVAAPIAGTRGAARGDLVDAALGWLARVPDGRIDIEAGTVRLAATPSSHGPIELSVNRATLRRATGRLSGSAYVYLPEGLGHSIFVSLSLEGDPRDRRSLRGESRIAGQRLAIGPWGEILAPELRAPTTGLLDVRGRLRFEHGALRSAQGEFVADGAGWNDPGLPGRHFGWAHVRADAELESDPRTAHLRLANLFFTRGGAAAPAGLTLAWQPTAPQVAGTAHDVPAAALIVLAHLVPGAATLEPLLDLETHGTASDLRFEFDRTRAPQPCWTLHGSVRELSWRAPGGRFAASGLMAEIAGSEQALDIDVRGDRAGLSWSPRAVLDALDLSGRLRLIRRADAWTLSSDRLRLAGDAGEVLVSGELAGSRDGAAELAVRAEASILDLGRPGVGRLVSGETLGLPGANRVAAGRITALRFETHGRITRDAGDPPLRSSGRVTFADVDLDAAPDWPAATNLAGRITWKDARYQVDLTAGSSAGLSIVAARASRKGPGAPRVDVRARGRIEPLLAWARGVHDLQVPAGLLQADLRGDALVDFTLRPRRGARPVRTAWRLVTSLDRAELRLAGIESVVALQGSVTLEDGQLRPTRFRGEWLGGPVELRVLRPAPLRQAGGGIRLRADGAVDGARLARWLAADSNVAAPMLEGRTEWHARFDSDADGAAARPPATEFATGVGWRLTFDSTLAGLGSHLPEPFAKGTREAVPLHIELAPQDPDARLLALSLGGRLSALIRLTGDSAEPRSERGVIRFASDARALVLPPRPGLVATGRLPRIDLSQLLTVAASVPGLSQAALAGVDVEADSVVLAGERFADVRVTAHNDAGRMTVTLASDDLAGRIDWAADDVGSGAAHVSLDRLRLADGADERALARLAGALPRGGASVDIRDLRWRRMQLGHVSLDVVPEAGGLRIEALHAERPSLEVRGAGRCAMSAGECRLHVEVNSDDAAASLRDFGFREEITGTRARFIAELAWPLNSAGRPSLERPSGQLELEIDGGRVAADMPTDPAADSLPLIALATRIVNPPGDAPFAAERAAASGFDVLSGTFQVDRGVATTTDLRLAAAEYEILGRGRIDFVARDYDQEFLILRGADRLPEPVQRIGGGPRVAAAWLALRGALRPAVDGAPGPEAFRLHGPWEAPVLDRIGALP